MLTKKIKKDPRGRPQGRPNKVCGTCFYFNGEKEANSGFVFFNTCLKNNKTTNSRNTCKEYLLDKKQTRIKKISIWKKLIDLLIKYKIIGYRLYWRKI